MFPLDDPRPWRNKADELRAAADSTKSPEAQRTYLRLAESYDRMAKLVENPPGRYRVNQPT